MHRMLRYTLSQIPRRTNIDPLYSVRQSVNSFHESDCVDAWCCRGRRLEVLERPDDRPSSLKSLSIGFRWIGHVLRTSLHLHARRATVVKAERSLPNRSAGRKMGSPALRWQEVWPRCCNYCVEGVRRPITTFVYAGTVCSFLHVPCSFST